jgi:hypothetical protein
MGGFSLGKLDIIIIYSENHTKHTERPCGQNAEYFGVKTDGTYTGHCALKD